MGGGLWTALALPLLYKFGWEVMFIFSTLALLLWIGAAVIFIRRKG